MIKQANFNEIEIALEALQVKMKWKINSDGKKVKVVRNSETEYSVYNDGYYVNTEINWQNSFEMVKVLLK
jgi:hypothetical protein